MLALYVLCSARSSFISILFLFPSRRLCRRGGGAVLRLQAVWWVSAIAGPGPLLLVCTARRWSQFSQWSHKGCFSFRAVFDLAIVQLQQSARLRGHISLPLKKKLKKTHLFLASAFVFISAAEGQSGEGNRSVLGVPHQLGDLANPPFLCFCFTWSKTKDISAIGSLGFLDSTRDVDIAAAHQDV